MLGGITKPIAYVYAQIDKPYKVIFLLEALVSGTGGFIHFFFGDFFEKHRSLIWDLIALAMSFGIVALLFFTGLSKWRHRRARMRSTSPWVRILDSFTTLNYSDPDLVLYERQLRVRSIKGDVEHMHLYIDWQGKTTDYIVKDEVGCKISLRKAHDEPGYYLDIAFSRSVTQYYEYNFGFMIEFKNSNRMILPFVRKINPYNAERQISQTLIMQPGSRYRFVHTVFKHKDSVKSIMKEQYFDNIDQSTFLIPNPHQERGYRISLDIYNQ